MRNAIVPTVLSISGHDPSGGAGIQADIETISTLGCRAATAITCLTVQDTRNVYRLEPVAVDLMEQQARAVLDDLPVAAIKIGLIGQAESAARIALLLREYPDIPAILDPVLTAGGGRELSDPALLETIKSELLPEITLLTPNSPEARQLSGESDLERCAATLLAMGCDSLLITGGQEDEERLINRLYTSDEEPQSWSWLRLKERYHGSGCTLAAASAALLAQQTPLIEAVAVAQEYTWQSLSHGIQAGHGQTLPNRFYLQ